MRMVSTKSAREEIKGSPDFLERLEPRVSLTMPSLTAQDPWRHPTKSGRAAINDRPLVSSEVVDGAGRQMTAVDMSSTGHH